MLHQLIIYSARHLSPPAHSYIYIYVCMYVVVLLTRTSAVLHPYVLQPYFTCTSSVLHLHFSRAMEQSDEEQSGEEL